MPLTRSDSRPANDRHVLSLISHFEKLSGNGRCRNSTKGRCAKSEIPDICAKPLYKKSCSWDANSHRHAILLDRKPCAKSVVPNKTDTSSTNTQQIETFENIVYFHNNNNNSVKSDYDSTDCKPITDVENARKAAQELLEQYRRSFTDDDLQNLINQETECDDISDLIRTYDKNKILRKGSSLCDLTECYESADFDKNVIKRHHAAGINKSVTNSKHEAIKLQEKSRDILQSSRSTSVDDINRFEKLDVVESDDNFNEIYEDIYIRNKITEDKQDVIKSNDNFNEIYEDIYISNRLSQKNIELLQQNAPELDTSDGSRRNSDFSESSGVSDYLGNAEQSLSVYENIDDKGTDNEPELDVRQNDIEQKQYVKKLSRVKINEYENEEANTCDNNKSLQESISQVRINPIYEIVGQTISNPIYDQTKSKPVYENVEVINTNDKMYFYKESTIYDANKNARIRNISKIPINGKKDQKEYIVDELVGTEQTYIQNLSFVLEKYATTIRMTSNIGSLMGKCNYIFTNMDKILYETIVFLEDIKSCKYNYSEIGKTFRRHKSLFDRYPTYCRNNRKSLALITGDFKGIVQEIQVNLDDKLGLSSYLLKPVQRLGKYELLLKNLYKYLKKEGNQAKEIYDAIAMVKQVSQRSNDLITIDSIADNPFSLADTGEFIKRDNFKLISPKRADAVLFLFKNMIIIAINDVKQIDHVTYKRHIRIDSLSRISDDVTPTFTLVDYPNSKKSADATYLFEAKDNKIKQKWIHEVDKLLWAQLLKCREEANLREQAEGVRTELVDLKTTTDRGLYPPPNLSLTPKSQRRNTVKAEVDGGANSVSQQTSTSTKDGRKSRNKKIRPYTKNANILCSLR